MPKLPPEGVIANQIQCSRIPGTRDALGETHSAQVCMVWARGIVEMLHRYGYEITPKKVV